MKFWKRRFISLLLLIVPIMVSAEDSMKLLPELAEWGAGGLAFYTAKRLDHQPAWSERSSTRCPTDNPFHDNTISSSKLYAVAGVTAMGIGLIPNNDGWLDESAYHHTKGLAQALSFTYLATNLTKNIVGRRRPCFANYPAAERVDANKSFPSGHSSISFAIATYSSLYALDHFDGGKKAGSWIYALGSHTLAGYVGYTRIIDNRHYLSDVIAGGLLGSGVAWLVYEYQQRKSLAEGLSNETNKSLVPVFLTVSIPF